MKLPHQLNQPIVRNHLFKLVAGTVLALLVYFYVVSELTITVNNSKSITILCLVLSGIFSSYVITLVSKRLDVIVSWQKQLTSRFLLGIMINAVIAFVPFSILIKIFTQLWSIELDLETVYLKLAIIVFIIILLYTIIYFAFYSYFTYTKLQIDTVTYERKQIDLQLKALKSQLSSHFLFNNLNTISSLVNKDFELAENYTRVLAAIYDYTLNSYNKKFVTLNDELKITEDYLLILKTRFGNAINYTTSIPKNLLQSKIPPLTLQMLIENSVKHNQTDTNNKLCISIEADNHFISVKNNITKAPLKVNSFHIGLKNIIRRYKLLNNSVVNFQKDSHFTVKLPVIN